VGEVVRPVAVGICMNLSNPHISGSTVLDVSDTSSIHKENEFELSSRIGHFRRELMQAENLDVR
jgi:hypothetical protein